MKGEPSPPSTLLPRHTTFDNHLPKLGSGPAACVIKHAIARLLARLQGARQVWLCLTMFGHVWAMLGYDWFGLSSAMFG